jgi:inhibitor of cysteine peptidase
MITIDKTLNGKKIQANKGDTIKVQLAENPTTGYLWRINSFNDKHINIKENKYEVASEAIGAGGMKTFYFEVINVGLSELNLTHGKPWENEVIDTFNLTIES